MERAILMLKDTISDISGDVQVVLAKDKKTGEVKARGCGLLISRTNHINGDTAIFLSYKGSGFVLGSRCNYYALGPWKQSDYEAYDMVPTEPGNFTDTNIYSIRDTKHGIV